MRKSIFNKIRNVPTILLEDFLRIDVMFSDNKCITQPGDTYGLFAMPLEQWINQFLFKSWKYRGRYVTIADVRYSFGISREVLSKAIDLDSFLTYLEFVDNMIYLLMIADAKTYKLIDNSCVLTIIDNIKDVLERLNYKPVFQEDRFIIIEKDAAATAVAENYDDIADAVIEYKRFALKGNLTRKCEIIIALAKKVEPIRTKLKTNGFSDLQDDVFFLLNNINIRHNNLEGSKSSLWLADMSNDKLEQWYDKTYDMLLLSLLSLSYIDTKNEIKTLKQNLTQK